MRYSFGAIVLVVGSVHGAVTRYNAADSQPAAASNVLLPDPFDLQPAFGSNFVNVDRFDLQAAAASNVMRPDERYLRKLEDPPDLQPQPSNVIELDQLDPRNQPVVSSFSVVETAGGSASGRAASGRRSNGGTSFSTARGGDDDPVASKSKGAADGFSYDKDLNSLLPDRKDGTDNGGRKARRKEKAEPRQPAETATSMRLPSPRSINELLAETGGQRLAAAGSSKSPKKLTNGDLSKSGSYLNGKVGDGFEEGYDKEKHYDKEGGKKFVEARKSEAGQKAQQGYKKEEGFDKTEDEKHGKEQKKAIIDEKEGEKKGHVEQEKTFGEEYKGNEGEKGISVTKKGGHKKGNKKSGFHKVHHKDEYKKDEVFYDEAHDGDEREENAHEHEKHAKEKGGTAKKTLVDSQYHEGHGQKKGAQDKGHSYEEASGHKKEAGQEAHHDKKSDYDKKGGVKEGKKYGHAEGGTSGGGYADHDVF